MKKKKCIILLILLLILVPGALLTARADYTPEQKAAAKAWLSSHGYAPTYGGAAQAYQDYLNGKFDGVPGVPPRTNTEAAATTEDQAETSEQERKLKENTDRNREEAFNRWISSESSDIVISSDGTVSRDAAGDGDVTSDAERITVSYDGSAEDVSGNGNDRHEVSGDGGSDSDNPSPREHSRAGTILFLGGELLVFLSMAVICVNGSGS